DLNERGFSGAIFPDEGMDLPGEEVKGNATQRLNGAEGFGDARESEQRGTHLAVGAPVPRRRLEPDQADCASPTWNRTKRRIVTSSPSDLATWATCSRTEISEFFFTKPWSTRQ